MPSFKKARNPTRTYFLSPATSGGGTTAVRLISTSPSSPWWPFGSIHATSVHQMAKKKIRIGGARPDRRRRFRPRRDWKLYGFCSSHSQEPLHGIRSQRNQPKNHELSFEKSGYLNFRARFRPIHNESHFDVVTKVDPCVVIFILI